MYKISKSNGYLGNKWRKKKEKMANQKGDIEIKYKKQGH